MDGADRFFNYGRDNAAAAATALTIRHSRFAALTLAKLVASLALHPPVSATGSGGLRASSVSLFARHLLAYGRRLLLSCSLIALDLSCPLSQSVTPDSRTQPCPRGSGQRSWTPGRAQHDRRGKMKNRPVGVYSEPSDSSFSLPRGAHSSTTPSFIQAAFTSHTGSLLLSSLKKVTSSSSSSSSFTPC